MPPSPPSSELSGRIAVVTGAARGIGFATVTALADAGALPVLLDRDSDALSTASASLTSRGVEHRAHVLDVGDGAAIDRIFEEIASWRGRIDILVNNAGIALRRPAVELAQTEWQAVVDVNLTGVFLCARAAARSMLASQRGAIVNVGSIMSLSGGGLYPNISYQATKGALVNLTRALAVEWAQGGIRINTVAPTWVRTELTRALVDDPQVLERMLAMTPMRRLAMPEDVAAAIVFLCSDRAAMITGHTLPVDGGFLAQ
jgi:NAD(P)-dependent dehydrogenase (short-subunit alcohol dehydrogenase family)